MFTRENADKLFDFIGYGNLDGPIWFLGMEEGGGSEKTIPIRLTFDAVMDLEDAQKELGNTKYFGSRPELQSTWSVLSKIALGLNGSPNDRESARKYQATELGRKDSETLLCELLPLPNPSIEQWIYADLFDDPRLKDREAYEEHILPMRHALYIGLFEEHKPDMVICYGETFWPSYKELFSRAEFRKETLQHPSEEKKRLPVDTVSYARTNYAGLVFLIYHPVARGMNAEWRIDAIVRLIQSEQNAQSASRR